MVMIRRYFHATTSVFRSAVGAVQRQQGGNHSITNFFSKGLKRSSSSSSAASAKSTTSDSAEGSQGIDENERQVVVPKRYGRWG